METNNETEENAPSQTKRVSDCCSNDLLCGVKLLAELNKYRSRCLNESANLIEDDNDALAEKLRHTALGYHQVYEELTNFVCFGKMPNAFVGDQNILTLFEKGKDLA